MARRLFPGCLLPACAQARAAAVERLTRALAALEPLDGEPPFAVGEQAAQLHEQNGSRCVGAPEHLDALEPLQQLPGLVHQARLEGDYAGVCVESSRERRQSRQ
jgi:hypothetical protein